MIHRQASKLAHMARQAAWKKMKSCPAFRDAVNPLRELGIERRNYWAWLYHPFGGQTPPLAGPRRHAPALLTMSKARRVFRSCRARQFGLYLLAHSGSLGGLGVSSS